MGGITMIKVVLVDELNVISEGLQLIIDNEVDMQMVGIVNNQNNNLFELKDLSPNIILFQVKYFHTEIGNQIHAYKRKYPETKLVYISPQFDHFLFYDLVKNKPNGFLNNDFPPERFINIIRDVYHEQYVLSGKIAQELINGIQYIDELKKIILKKKLEERNIAITIRDLDILYLIYLEKNNKEITKELKLPEKSVRYYVSKAYKKLERKKRTEVIELLEELIEG